MAVKFSGWRSRSRGSFEVFVMSATPLCTHLVDSFLVCHKYNPWVHAVSRPIQKVKRNGHKALKLIHVI